MSIITFSDVHWGAHGQDAQALYEELTIIKQAILEEDTKLVVMCGDYYDRKIDFTSDAAVLSIKFMNELREACRIKGAILRFIRGTRSHDLNQLNNFKSFETGDGMFRVIDTVEEEEVLPGFKVLYIPEEYPIDYKQYYEELLYKKPDGYYDFIFGHGSIHYAIWYLEHCLSEKNMGTAPVFNEKDFTRVCKNKTVFGHVHKHCIYDNKVFYNGSFSRQCHGEEDAKGFLIFDMQTFEHFFIENEKAPIFKALKFSQILEDAHGSFEEAAQFIQNLSASDGKLRIDFDTPVTDEQQTQMNIIKEVASKQPNMTVKARKKTTKTSGIAKEFDFLIDGHKNPIDTISKYIKITTGKDLNSSELNDIITKTDSKDK